MLNMNLRLRLVHLPSVKVPEIATTVHHLLLIDHLVMIWRLKLWWRQTCSTVVHRGTVNITFLNFLAQLVLHGCGSALAPYRAGRVWWRRRAVIHGHLFPRLSRVVGVEERLLWRKIYFVGNRSLRLALLSWKSSTTRRRVVLRLHYFVRWCDVAVVITSSPVLQKQLEMNPKILSF